jgi:Right handed beta helix region/HYDIN/CFA65/VesB-like, Ig-like domain/Cep192 domain 4
MLVSISLGQTTIHVPADQPTIQAAINASVNGGMVLVAPGTYHEHLDFLGKAITIASTGGPAVTTIDGSLTGTVVVFHTSETSAAVLQGFTITRGQNSNTGTYTAGGIEILGASPTIAGNIITANKGCAGVGIYSSGGSPTIQNNTISNNTQTTCGGGTGGGGIALFSSGNAQVTGNTITANANAAGGGGMSVAYGGTPTIQNNVISKNSASQGGGIYIFNGAVPRIIQNLIVNNAGNGIWWLAPSGTNPIVLLNNTIANNDYANGSALYASGWDSAATVTNNLLIGKDGQTAVYCDVNYDPGPPQTSFNDVFSNGGTTYGGSCGNLTGMNSNVSVDPLFANVPAGDYHLDFDSPALDVGNNSATYLSSSDLSGNPRVIDATNLGTPIVDLGAYEYQGATTMTLSPTALTYSPQKTGTTSDSQPVTVTNTGSLPLYLKAPQIGSDYRDADSCQGPQGIAPGKSCMLNVTFAPASTGERDETMIVSGSNLSATPTTVTLSGFATAPKVSLSPSTLTFLSQALFTMSAIQQITVTNIGDAELAIAGLSISGDFQQTNNCPTTLAPSGSCMVDVTFTPTATRVRTGVLTVTDDAANSPQTAGLSGTGTGPEITFSSMAIYFPNQSVGTLSSPQTLTVTNTGSDNLAISSIQISGDFSQTNNCPATVAPAGSCQVTVSFLPTQYGARTGVVAFTDNAAASPQQVALSGAGTSALIYIQSPVAPTAVVGGASVSSVFYVYNVGNETLVISSVVASGEDFSQTTTCSSAVPPQTGCTITVQFTPVAPGTRSGTLTLTDNAPGSPNKITLSGTGLAGYPVPTITSTSPTTLPVGNTSQTLTIIGSAFWPQTSVLWDNTPLVSTVVSGTQLTATVDATLLAQLGEHQITVVNPAPGGGSSTAVTVTLYRALQLSARGLVYDPYRRLLYASIASGGAMYPSSVVAIDPATGSVSKLVSPGAEPTKLALSDDGQFLYIGVDPQYAIQRFNLYSGTVDLTIPLGTSGFLGGYAAGDILVLPGAPHSIAVALATYTITTPYQIVQIFDDAVARSNSGGAYSGSLAIAADYDPNVLLIGTLGISPSSLTAVKIDNSGLTTLNSRWNSQTSAIASNGSLLFSSSIVLDPATLQQTGYFTGATGWVTSVYPERGTNLAFLLEGSNPNKIWAGNIATFGMNGHVELPAPNYPYNTSWDVVRWGTDGLAFRSYSGSVNVTGASSYDTIFILRSSITNPSSSTNPVPTISATAPDVVMTQSTNLVLTVKGTNFVPGSVVRWNGSDRSTTFVNPTQLTARIGAADLATDGSVAITVANPAPGGGESSVTTMMMVKSAAGLVAPSRPDRGERPPESGTFNTSTSLPSAIRAPVRINLCAAGCPELRIPALAVIAPTNNVWENRLPIVPLAKLVLRDFPAPSQDASNGDDLASDAPASNCDRGIHADAAREPGSDSRKRETVCVSGSEVAPQ